MHIAVYHNMPKIEEGMYPVPICENDIMKYDISLDDATKLGDLFVKEINDVCKSLVGPYEYDYLDVGQCYLLKQWIKNNSDIIKEYNLVSVFNKISEFCDIAIDKETIIEIEC